MALSEYGATRRAETEIAAAAGTARTSAYERPIGLLAAFVYLVIAILLALASDMRELGRLSWDIVALSVGAFFLMAIGHVLLRRLLSGRMDPFSIDLGFLGGFFLFNLGIWAQVSVGWIPIRMMVDLPGASNAARALVLSVAAVPGFLAGYLLGRTLQPHVPVSSERRFYLSPNVGRIGFVVFVLAVTFRVAYIFFVIGPSAFFSSSYVTVGLDRTLGGRFYNVSETLATIGVSTMAVGYAVVRGRLAPKAFWPIFIFFVLLLLVDGERGTVLWMILGLVIARHFLLKRISWKWVLIGGVILTFVFAGVRVARALPTRSLESLVNAVMGKKSSVSVQSTLTETGGSFAITCRTMNYIPLSEDYKYGKTALSALWSTVPGLSGAVQHMVSADTDWAYYVPPAEWLTYRELGYGATSGLGFNSVAEAYLNFGVMGVPSMFLLMGLFLAWLEFRTLNHPTVLRLVLLSLSFGLVFYSSRGTIANWFRPFAWAFALIAVAQLGAKHLARIRPQGLLGTLSGGHGAAAGSAQGGRG